MMGIDFRSYRSFKYIVKLKYLGINHTDLAFSASKRSMYISYAKAGHHDYHVINVDQSTLSFLNVCSGTSFLGRLLSSNRKASLVSYFTLATVSGFETSSLNFSELENDIKTHLFLIHTIISCYVNGKFCLQWIFISLKFLSNAMTNLFAWHSSVIISRSDHYMLLLKMLFKFLHARDRSTNLKVYLN